MSGSGNAYAIGGIVRVQAAIASRAAAFSLSQHIWRGIGSLKARPSRPTA
jgi:hypothetical protein